MRKHQTVRVFLEYGLQGGATNVVLETVNIALQNLEQSLRKHASVSSECVPTWLGMVRSAGQGLLPLVNISLF